MTETVDLPLFIWLSPSFPVGAFAYSHGLEWSVQAGEIKDAEGLQTLLETLLEHGALRSDAILLAAAWQAARSADEDALAEVNALALALSPSRERLLETSAQGNAFIATALRTWPCAAIERLKDCSPDAIAYAVAIGAAAAGHGVGVQPALEAFALASCSNLISAAVRLGPIGQTDGQRVLAALCAPIRKLATFAVGSTLADLGTCVWRSDIGSMQHETLYSRLFRS